MDINNVQFSSQKVRVGQVGRTGERSGAYRVLVGRPEGNMPLGRSRSRWMDNIKTNL
jgi:hypothetical protein